MPRYKRTAEEAGLDVSLEPHVEPAHVEILSRLRSMWEFASFMQYIFLFGHVVKISDDFDIEVRRYSNPCSGFDRHYTYIATSETDGILMTGPRKRMPEPTAVTEAGSNRPGASQIRLISSRANVCTECFGLPT